MKILHLSYGPGGVHAHLFHTIIDGYRAAGHEVWEVWLTGSVPADYISPANRVVALGFAPNELTGLRRWFAARRMRAFLQRERFDVVITHRRKPAELIAAASRDLPIRQRFAVWHDEHEFDRWQIRLRAARLYRDFVLIGCSEAVRDDILAAGTGLRREQVVGIDNAIDVDAFETQLVDRDDARAHLTLPHDAFVIGTIGRLVEKKGHADLIRAFARIAPDHPQALLVIIGAGPLQDALAALVAELKLQERVRLTGAVPHAFRYARAFDLFALPSYREGLPIALLEAACARLPCVASDIGGNRVVLGETNALIRAGDIDGLAHALRKMVELPAATRTAEGEALYQRLRQRFDRPVMMRAYAALLR